MSDKPARCTYCGTAFQAEDDPGYEATPGVWLCDQCWDNADPAYPQPVNREK